MLSHLKSTALAGAILGMAVSGSAFSMLGPYDTWQVERIGYNLGGDIGGPMDLGEEYRRNVKTIYYAYDSSFLQYFGVAGTNSIEKAIAIMNAIPPVSQMSSNLSEFPLDTRRVNYTASALNLVDLGTWTLEHLLEELGVAQPEDHVWCLLTREAFPTTTNYTVIKRNFDPVTLQPSSFVNGVLYSYQIVEFQNPDIADAIEVQLDPLQTSYTSVASRNAFAGDYYTGLTRDDMGALRHLYGNMYPLEHWHVETLPSETTRYFNAGSGGNPWVPIGGTNNNVNTNLFSISNFVNQAVRPGVDKITYKSGNYDSIIGAFIVVTNVWDDTYITNSTVFSQTVQRVINQPDILFQAENMGPAPFFTRTDTSGWANNDAINGASTLAGPGVIEGPMVFTYNKVGPYFINLNPFFLDEFNQLSVGLVWGSFDGTTNPPIVFPNGMSIQAYQAQVIFGGYDDNGLAWLVPNSINGTPTNTTDDVTTTTQ